MMLIKGSILPRNRYISDLHFNHFNVIRYCRRPFSEVREMNEVMLRNLREAESEGARLHILGDVAFKLEQLCRNYGWLQYPERHILVVGNHDKFPSEKAIYDSCFGKVVGDRKSYRTNSLMVEDVLSGVPIRLLLSHYPQADLRGAHINLYGHHHNDAELEPEKYHAAGWSWLLESPSHINVSAELVDYVPRTIEELIERNDRCRAVIGRLSKQLCLFSEADDS